MKILTDSSFPDNPVKRGDAQGAPSGARSLAGSARHGNAAQHRSGRCAAAVHRRGDLSAEAGDDAGGRFSRRRGHDACSESMSRRQRAYSLGKLASSASCIPRPASRVPGPVLAPPHSCLARVPVSSLARLLGRQTGTCDSARKRGSAGPPPLDPRPAFVPPHPCLATWLLRWRRGRLRNSLRSRTRRPHWDCETRTRD